MLKSRAKLTVVAVTECVSWNDSRRQKVKFSTIYDDSIPEDRRFQTATPTGSMKLTIDNPALIDSFKIGEAYYVDFTPAE